jgi:hypothetical protein
MKRVVHVLSLFVLMAAVAQADTISLSADRDNYLMGPGEAALTGMNYGASKDLSVGLGAQYFATITGLLSFDVSALPAGTIDAITLRLHSNSWVDSVAAGALPINVRALLPANKGWVEGTGATDVGTTEGSCYDWQAAHPLGNVAWASGGSFSSADYSATLLSTVTVSASNVGTYVDFTFAGTPTELTGLIDGWRTDNAGLVVSATPTTGIILMRFDTSENGTPAFAPHLLVSIVPEPSSFVLLAGALFGVLAYAWRKRR